eukprot:TRINITY_DN1893_c4_g1_i1.p1 TRINITY_DN1893_c4_g1~~TRINITY_DN1893_c4_g1_i1.p1  ORF type:complete len:260 (+),score=38.82 TRINITY_DN1893_c4_g1_i1:45-824(+)
MSHLLKFLKLRTTNQTRMYIVQNKRFYTPMLNQHIKSTKKLPNFQYNRVQKRSFFVQTEPTPNPESIKFFPDNQKILDSGTRDYPNSMSATGSPLARFLFQQEGVKRVFLSSDFITVTKDDTIDWEDLRPIIIGSLMEFYSTGQPVLAEEDAPKDTAIQPEDSEEVAMIKELLETRIRPAVQGDGGDITYLGFVDGVVFVKLQGSCSGCPSSSSTLKNGIERMLVHWVPEVTAVMELESEEEFERVIKNGEKKESSSDL